MSPPPNNARSPSKSACPDGSPKHMRRRQCFTQRYLFARQYRSPSAHRSHRFGGRTDRDRCMSYRGSHHRSPHRQYRSPLRARTSPRPSRYRRSQSISHSPTQGTEEGGGGYSRSPVRSRSPPAGKPRPGDRARSVSRNPSPRRASDDKSWSASASPDGKKGLVSYGDASPDSAEK